MNYYKKTKKIPQAIIFAQELQKSGDYIYSRKIYEEFFLNNQNHALRFKALFEIADNIFYEGKYILAEKKYLEFMEYCMSQDVSTETAHSLVEAYVKLAKRRLIEITTEK